MSVSPAFLLLMASALCVITALIHSVLGERRLIGPLLASDVTIMQSNLARQVMRFAWHWTTVLWFMVAAVLALSAYQMINSPILLVAIGGLHVVMGVADAFITRGQHIGWPLITLIGGLVLAATFQTPIG